jgi:hypothetical protein
MIIWTNEENNTIERSTTFIIQTTSVVKMTVGEVQEGLPKKK